MKKEDRAYFGTEEQEQTTVVSWCRASEGRFPELALLYHVPNGGKRGKAEAARFRAAGVKAGVPDLCLPVAAGGYHGLYVEMKTAGGRVSPAQKWYMERLMEQGYFCRVCYGADAAIALIKAYLKGEVRREK